MKILIVEDQENIRKLLSLRFKKTDYEIHFAANGKLGLEKAREIKPELILMDLHMPEMGGDIATQKLRQKGYKGVIVAFTSSALMEGQKRMKDAGCDYIIVKPPGKNFIPTITNIIEKERTFNEKEGKP